MEKVKNLTLLHTLDFVTFQYSLFNERGRLQYLYETTFCQKYLKVSCVPWSGRMSSLGPSKASTPAL